MSIIKTSLPPNILRYIIGLLIIIGTGLLLFFILLFTETALSVWEKLQNYPVWLIIPYIIGITLIAFLGSRLLLRTLKPTPQKIQTHTIDQAPEQRQPHIAEKIQQAQSKGVDTQAVEVELQTLVTRQKDKEIYISLFGSISSGKSSLINAFLPESKVSVDPRGGTTSEITYYQWQQKVGEQIILTDLPGLQQTGQQDDDWIKQETQRAHIVIYLCEGDLTRDQYNEIQSLIALNKPLIVAINKIDLYSMNELQMIKQRLMEYFSDIKLLQVVTLQSGGTREVTKVYPDGREELVIRQLKPQTKELEVALNQYLELNRQQLDENRDTGFYHIAEQKLTSATDQFRQQKAQAIVQAYTKKAIAGALAAITPGSDILIQGYLGFHLVKELCQLYDVPATEMDIKKFIELASKHVGKTLPMILAFAGNILKAFPGIGTVGGSFFHAVAYGLIFESLGKSVASALTEQQSWQSTPTMQRFEENLSENMESRAQQMARLAFDIFAQKSNNK